MESKSTTCRPSRLWIGLLAALCGVLPAMFGCPKSDEPGYYIKKLEKDNEEVQRRAVEELVRMHKKAMPEIRIALKSENPHVREGCAAFLAKVRRMESLEACGELIDDPEKDVRLKTIESVAALAQVWKKKSVELLGRAFEDEDPECVKLAGEGLRDMKFEEATNALRQFFETGEGIQPIYAAKLLYETEPSPETARPILEGLISDDKAIREAANENLKELKDKLVEPLVTFIDTEARVARAQMALEELRGPEEEEEDEPRSLIDELDVILDSKRAAQILMALGTIADEASVEKLKKDLDDTKLESTWRVGAARGMAVAALSARSTEAQKADIRSTLSQRLSDEKEDKRIRIGAAIALCQLREEAAVRYLLDSLDKFEEEIQREDISEAKQDDLTQLRIWSQEALTTSGEFVVDFLMDRMGKEDAGPIIRWAGSKTCGELKVARAVPYLGRFMKAEKDPDISIEPDGQISQINMGKPITEKTKDTFAFLFDEVEEGAVLNAQDMKNWEDLGDDDVAKVQQMVGVFKHPDYVRWSAAIALGRIGGERAVTLLREAEAAEGEFLERLMANRKLKYFYRREKVVNGVIGRHEDVVFYIRKALEDLGAVRP